MTKKAGFAFLKDTILDSLAKPAFQNLLRAFNN